MKPNQTVPLLASLSSLATAAPPLLMVAGIACGLVWLFSDDKEDSPTPEESDDPSPITPIAPAANLADLSHEHTNPTEILRRQVTRDDVAEALAYGARSMTRQEAVTALQALGFKKTAAYKAVSPEGRFGHLIERTADGLIEWKG